MFVLTLIYADLTKFLIGGFGTIEAAKRWMEEEKTRPYWDMQTQFELVDEHNEIVNLSPEEILTEEVPKNDE